jgi:hypothetical protein
MPVSIAAAQSMAVRRLMGRLFMDDAPFFMIRYAAFSLLHPDQMHGNEMSANLCWFFKIAEGIHLLICRRACVLICIHYSVFRKKNQ